MKSIIKNNIFIIIILAVSAIKWAAWIAIVPLFQTPDEPAHFCYVQKLAENKKVSLDKTDDNFTKEVLDAWREGGHERVPFSKINKYRFEPGEYSAYEKLHEKPGARKELVAVPFVPVQYPPLYYLCGTVFYNMFHDDSIIARDFAVRFFSALLGLLTVFVIYRISKLIFPGKTYISEAVAILVSFNPMFTFIFSSINSDCLLFPVFSMFLYYNIKIALNKHNKSDIFKIAAVIILGLFTKQQFIISLFILGVSLLINEKVKLKAKVIMFISGVVLLSASLAYVRSHFPLQIIGVSAGQFVSYLFTSFTKFLYFDFINYFFGAFGWLDTHMPAFFTSIISIIFYACIILSLVDLYRSIKTRKSVVPYKVYALFIMPIIIFSASVIYVDANAHYGLQGRYFYPVIALLYLLPVCGFLSIIPAKFRERAMLSAAALTVLLNVYCLFGVVITRYYL